MDDAGICGATQSRCVCAKLPGHPPPHSCGLVSPVVGHCQGEWLDDGTIVTYPTGEKSLAEAKATMDSVLRMLNGTV